MTRTMLMTTVALVAATPSFAAPATPAAAVSAMSASNPFAKPSALPFQTVDYATIKDSDYLPAFLAGMAQNKREIDSIANQKAAPTFDNTLGRLENSGLMLERVQLAFSAVAGANTNDTLDAVDTKTAPLLAQHRDYLYLNKKLFARVKSLHDRQASLKLTAEQSKLLDVYYQGFVHAGAQLGPDKQVQLKALNKRISSLESAFGQKLRIGIVSLDQRRFQRLDRVPSLGRGDPDAGEQAGDRGCREEEPAVAALSERHGRWMSVIVRKRIGAPTQSPQAEAP